MQRFRSLIASSVLLAVTALPFAGGPLASVVRADDDSATQVAASVDAAPLAQNVDEQALMDLTNADRAQAGMAPLQFDPATLQIARSRAQAQYVLPDLSHLDASGQYAFVSLLSQDNLLYARAGENLARSSGSGQPLVTELNAALMLSPTHRANILQASYNMVSIGEAQDIAGRTVFAEIFRDLPGAPS